MYIVSWLKGHPMIAMWVLVLVAFLLYWSGPANNQKAALGNNQVTLEKNPSGEGKSQDIAIEQQNSHGNTVHKTQENLQDKSDSNSIKTNTATTDKMIVTDEPSLSNVKAGLNKAPKDAIKTVTNNSVTTEGPFKESAEKLVNKQLSKGATTDLSSSSKEDMLLIAREAYWNNGLDEAAEIYQKLIKLEPNVLDHKGELGNVYWRQGFPKKAAELYSEIAIPMIKEGNSESVANMLGFIGLFYPDRATQINDHLQVKQK